MNNTISDLESKQLGLRTMPSVDEFDIKSVNLNDRLEIKKTGVTIDLDDLEDMDYEEDFPDDFLADFFEEQQYEQFLESQWTQFRRSAGGGYRLFKKRLESD